MSSSRRGARILLGALLAVVLAAPPASADPGEVDTTFADMGLLTEVRGITNRVPLVPSANGGLVVAWSAADLVGTQVGVSGYLASGDPDTDYGTNGSSEIEVPGSEAAESVNAIVDSRDRVLVVGFAYYPTTVKWFVARFRKNGDPDTKFSGDGVQVIGFPQGEAYAYGIAIRRGVIYVAGQVYLGVGHSEVAAAALFARTGELQDSFGNGGRQRYDVDGGYPGADWAIEIVTLFRRRIALAGAVGTATGSDTLVMWILPNGRLDDSFPGDGVFTPNLRKAGDDFANDLVSDGIQMVLGIGGDDQEPMILRLRGTGARDPNFGTNGLGRYPMDSFTPFALALDYQRRVLVAGFNVNLPVLRVKRDGTLSNFGVDGVATNTDTNGRGSHVMWQADGSILVSGHVSGDEIVVTKYLPA